MLWEGYVPNTYADPIGIPTSCYGHVGPENQPGRKFSDSECKALLEGDLAEAYALVKRCITSPMTDGQAAALTSFAYNVGPGAKGRKDGICMLKSGKQPRIRAYANAGMWPQACAELSKWIHPKIVSRGLARRRAAERAMCEGRNG